jgi:hypothetical protein
MTLNRLQVTILQSADAEGKLAIPSAKHQVKGALRQLTAAGLAVYEMRQYRGQAWWGTWITEHGKEVLMGR